jgi:hypothetical protein
VTVAIAPTSASLTAGSTSTQTFTATVNDTLNTAVVWEVNGVTGGNATVGTVTSSGVYTAPGTVPASGVVTVTVMSLADNTKTASAKVSIAMPSSGGGGGGVDWAVLGLGALLLARRLLAFSGRGSATRSADRVSRPRRVVPRC